MVFTHKWILTIKSMKIMLQSTNLEKLNKERVYGVCLDLPGMVNVTDFAVGLRVFGNGNRRIQVGEGKDRWWEAILSEKTGIVCAR